MGESLSGEEGESRIAYGGQVVARGGYYNDLPGLGRENIPTRRD